MEIQIREAQANDCERLMELVNELAVFERAPEEVSVTLEHFRESGFGKTPVWKSYVAEINGTIVGFALYYVRFSTWKGQTMYLEDILVTESHRKMGIGTLLFDRLLVEAREKNFCAISWQVLEWNEPAINFYKKYQPKFDAEWVNCRLPV